MTIFVNQGVLDDNSISDTDRCVCGGFRCVVHCPACGSTQCYAYHKGNMPAFVRSSPKPINVRAFRCKLCGEIYTEITSALACNAKTRYRQKVDAEQRVEKAIVQAPPEVVSDILDAARKHLTRVRSGEKQPTDADAERAKLFDPPRLEGSEE